MLPKYLFRKPKITLEDAMNPNADAPSAPDKMYVSCPGCKAMLLASDLEASAYVCPRCGRREGEAIPPEKLAELRKKYPNIAQFYGAR